MAASDALTYDIEASSFPAIEASSFPVPELKPGFWYKISWYWTEDETLTEIIQLTAPRKRNYYPDDPDGV